MKWYTDLERIRLIKKRINKGDRRNNRNGKNSRDRSSYIEQSYKTIIELCINFSSFKL